MIPDQKLTEHFSLYELTVTSNLALQEKNRELSTEQVQKLVALAHHCENLRRICGDGPLRIHSGYRSPDLNGATKGASSTSQHPKCEAVDFDVPGKTIQQAFDAIYAAAKDGKIRFGQLIIERANRGYATVEWVHCSVPGTLDPAKIGQVMKMEAGEDGVPHYVMVDKLDFPADA